MSSYHHRAFLLSSNVRGGVQVHVLILTSPAAGHPDHVHVRSFARADAQLLRRYTPLKEREWDAFCTVQRTFAPPPMLVPLAERHIQGFRNGKIHPITDCP